MDTIQSVLTKWQKLQDQVTQKQQELDAAKAELASFEAEVDNRLAGVSGFSPATAKAPTPKKAKVTAKATVTKAKKAVPKAAPKKGLTKAAFIKSQPKSMTAKQVVEAAKGAGIDLSETYVYNVRATSGAKKKTAKKTAKAAPKKAAKKVAKAAAKKVTKKKAAKKAAPKKGTTQTVTAASRKNAAEGRRAVATGKRPTLKEAMVIVMGKKTMNAQAVVDALAKKKWLPASSDHRQYISFMLSNNCPATFERTSVRGFYKVAKDAEKAPAPQGNGNGKKSITKGKKAAQAKPTAPAAAPTPDPQVDASIKQHWGIDTDVATDPFKGSDASAAGS